MKYRSMVALGSARDAGQRWTRWQPSEAALAILDELGIPRDVTRAEIGAWIEHNLAKLNVSQRQALLQKIGQVLKEGERHEQSR